MSINQKNKIAVIGLGLIGGSILKSLSKKGYRLIGVSRNQESIQKALDQEIISCGSNDLSIISDADIVFICTPINKIIYTLIEVLKIVDSKVIITDVASLKGFIIDFVNTSHKPINFIGGHPMAGTENKGFESSFSGLFQDSKWILTPSKWSNNEQISDLKEIISELGAKVIIADAQEHDKAAALISHLPLFLSQSLFKLVKDFPNTNISKLAMSMASSGFRDTTRLAATNPELSSDILKENLLNVLSSFRELINSSSILEKLLIEDQEGFISLCEEISEARKKIYSPEGKNIVDL